MWYTPNGNPVTNFSLAVNEGPKDATLWVKVVAWDKLAEHCNQYLHKGDQMMLEGRLKHNEWTDNNGQKHSQLQVTALYNGVRFLRCPHNPPKSHPDGDAGEFKITDEMSKADYYGDDDLPW